ncbi:hypothetical protein Vi05172_g6214 [Venturia inaequalis]|nr:hypothetical protein Vi05172_g6214 [Venturia inaequalis]
MPFSGFTFNEDYDVTLSVRQGAGGMGGVSPVSSWWLLQEVGGVLLFAAVDRLDLGTLKENP